MAILIESRSTNSEKSYHLWVLNAIIALLVILAYEKDLWQLVSIWASKPEYSHGFFIPVISFFLIWHQREHLKLIGLRGSWTGVLVVILGISLLIAGKLGFNFLVHYSFVVTLSGLALSLLGREGFRVIWLPVLYLLFMIPLPWWVQRNLTGDLQLLSSKLGFFLIRAFGVSAVLEGNIIELSNHTLHIREVCSGLRSLFSLMSFSFLFAYLFRMKLWMRVFVFLSGIPIAICMNGLRIGFTGYFADRTGNLVTEGFLHYFEGWVIFLISISILFGEVWFLTKIKRLGPLRQIFLPDPPKTSQKNARIRSSRVPRPYLTALIVLVVAALFRSLLSFAYVDSLLPARASSPQVSFAEFPMQLREWKGERKTLQSYKLEILRPSDYVSADYTNNSGEWVNLYAAYWEPGTKSGGPHSPEVCMPAGGWQILGMAPVVLDIVSPVSEQLVANRVQIEREGDKQLVYYWYQQGGRFVRSESSRWWYRRWQRLTRQRMDVAQVRLITRISDAENWNDGDLRLTAFAKDLLPVLVR
jgi:exosortase D (VPLPA-CTERM-specific)